MNKQSRKSVAIAIDTIRSVINDLEYIRDDEQDKMDNMPENLQMSERYEAMETAVDALENAITSLEDAVDSLEEIS
jgi:hypothetical protein